MHLSECKEFTFCSLFFFLLWLTNYWFQHFCSLFGLFALIALLFASVWYKNALDLRRKFNHNLNKNNSTERDQLTIFDYHVSRLAECTADGKATTNHTPQQRRDILINVQTDRVLEQLISCLIDQYFCSWYNPLVFSSSVTETVASVRAEMWRLLFIWNQQLARVNMVDFIARDLCLLLLSHLRYLRLNSESKVRARPYERLAAVTRQNNASTVDARLSSKQNAHSSANGKERLTSGRVNGLETDSQHYRHSLHQLSSKLLSTVLNGSTKSVLHSSTLARHVVTQLTSRSVLMTVIDYVCDPYLLNGHLIAYLQRITSDQRCALLQSPSLSYASSYEKFIALIRTTSCVSQLQTIRENIVAEIVLVSAMSQLKRSRGLHLEREWSTRGQSKGDLLHARNLQRYVNQLRYARHLCEKRALQLDSCVAAFKHNSLTQQPRRPLQHRVMELAAVLACPHHVDYLRRFLDLDGLGSLVTFWRKVEEMRACRTQTCLYMCAIDVYQVFLCGSTALQSIIRVDAPTRAQLEDFLTGNCSSLRPLYALQWRVQVYLETRQYHRFLVSAYYHQMIVDMQTASIAACGDDNHTRAGDGNTLVSAQVLVQDSTAHTTQSAVHCSHPLLIDDDDDVEERQQEDVVADGEVVCNQLVTSHRVRQLQRHALRKSRALAALHCTCAERRLVARAERELECVNYELREWRQYGERTHTWITHLGRWMVRVDSVQISPHPRADRTLHEDVVFILLVSCQLGSSPQLCAAPSPPVTALSTDQLTDFSHTGWVTVKCLQELVALSTCVQSLHSSRVSLHQPPRLPAALRVPRVWHLLRHYLFGRERLEHLRRAAQSYLDELLSDQTLSRSDALFQFLNPCPNTPLDTRGDLYSGTSAATDKWAPRQTSPLGEVASGAEERVENKLVHSEGRPSADRGQRPAEDLAEPLFALFAEVFELADSGSILRRVLVTFIQVAYDQTICRHICSTVQWLLSADCVDKYVRVLLGVFARDTGDRGCSAGCETQEQAGQSGQAATERDVSARQTQARALLHETVDRCPAVLTQLLGATQSRASLVRLFDAFQCRESNRMFVCAVLGRLLDLMLAPGRHK